MVDRLLTCQLCCKIKHVQTTEGKGGIRLMVTLIKQPKYNLTYYKNEDMQTEVVRCNFLISMVSGNCLK